MTVKAAFRITLADGTELVTSGDHRFLSNRGWKHVVPDVIGQRPHLTTQDWLVGTGGFASQPDHDDQYRRGYLCGMIRGDGSLGRYVDARRGQPIYRFRLALDDFEALARAEAFLGAFDVPVRKRVFLATSGTHREMRSIYSNAASTFAAVTGLIDWPVIPTPSWCRGFLAGIFDAEGSRSEFALRISNYNPEILARIEACAKRFDFDTVLERGAGCPTVRIRGGLREHRRFFHLTDPAITRKRDIMGQMVKTFADLRVVSIERLGVELPLYDITTGTGDFIANGVVSHNCFARPTHKYLDFNAGRDFEREIVVKVNAPEVLRAELARPSWGGEHVALGTNTDPYQWVEGRYRLMPDIWRVFRDAGNPCSVLTKSPLLLRDLDLMREINEGTDFSAALSIPTIDERAWRASEPHTPNPQARLEAVAELARAGIRTGVLVAPLMPGINDDPRQVREIVRRAREAGAAYVSGIALHLRGEVRQVFMEWLREYRPDLVERYERLYRRGAYASTDERRRLARLVQGPDLPPGQRMRGTNSVGERFGTPGAGGAAQRADARRARAGRNGTQGAGGEREPAAQAAQERLF